MLCGSDPRPDRSGHGLYDMSQNGGLTYRSGHGLDDVSQNAGLTYRSKSGRNVTLREKESLRIRNVTGNFENPVHVNDSPLEFCQ